MEKFCPSCATAGLVLQAESKSKQLDYNVLHKPEGEWPLRGKAAELH